MKRVLAGLAAALLAVFPASAHKGHAHGTGTLDVSLEGARLSLAFEASLEDFVGFERAARDDKERAAIEAMTAYLASGAAFVPNAEARCRSVEAGSGIVAQGRGHAAVQGTFAFECEAPARLEHVEAAVFDRYSRLRRIEARVVSAKGQSGSRLTPKSRRLPL